LYRFIFFPYRRKRIVDSILTFWFWVTLQTFSDKTYWRPTVINIASDDQGRVLLAQRRKDLIPGDIAWAFIQGGMDHISKGFFKRSQNENIKDIGSVFTSEVITNALRELKEETNLDVDDVEFEEKVYVQPSELYSISWLRFFYLGCQFKGQTKYILPIAVKNSKNIRHNWEHTCVAWFRPEEVRHFIPPGKMSEWELYQDINQ
jgi:8-oxo-dGTP pyrophosphatase MutT (NUDIX family)